MVVMMKSKKGVLVFLVVLVVAVTAFAGINLARAEELSFSEAVELLISLGVIAPEKAKIARTAALSMTTLGYFEYEGK
jgi:hypothetical protein